MTVFNVSLFIFIFRFIIKNLMYSYYKNSNHAYLSNLLK